LPPAQYRLLQVRTKEPIRTLHPHRARSWKNGLKLCRRSQTATTY